MNLSHDDLNLSLLKQIMASLKKNMIIGEANNPFYKTNYSTYRIHYRLTLDKTIYDEITPLYGQYLHEGL